MISQNLILNFCFSLNKQDPKTNSLYRPDIAAFKNKIDKEDKKNPKCCDTKLDHNSKNILRLKEEIPLEGEGFDTRKKRVEFGME